MPGSEAESSPDDAVAAGARRQADADRERLAFVGRFRPRTRAPWRDIIRGHALFSARAVLTCDEPVFFPLGRITAIMGPSGGGKTTLMRMVSGRAYGRDVHVDGLWTLRSAAENTDDADTDHVASGDAGTNAATTTTTMTFERWRLSRRDMRRRASFVEQGDDALDPKATPRQLVRFYVDALWRASVPSAAERRAMVERALADACMGDRASGTPAARLSGGQRKRACIAFQLARLSDIIFMDEPTTGLDSASCESVFDAVARANAHRGTTIIMAIHRPSERIFSGLHWLVLVAAGAVVYQGPPDRAEAFFAAHALGGLVPSPAESDPQQHRNVFDPIRHGSRYGRERDADKEGDGDGGEAQQYDDTREEDESYPAGGSTNATPLPPVPSVPDRIVGHVFPMPGESEPDYETRMRAIAAAARLDWPPDTRDRAAPSSPTTTTTTGASALRRAWCVLRCAVALMGHRARETVTPLLLVQVALKNLLLPVLITLALQSALRDGSPGTDGVTAGRAACVMAVMWTALYSAYETIAVLPGTHRQFVKHAEDGLYGAAAHLAAAHAADSAVRVPFLTCYALILYFGVGLRAGAQHFFVFFALLLVLSFVSRALCFACTCWMQQAHAAITVSVAMASSIIVSGIYMPPAIMPAYMQDLAYASFITYGVSIAIRNQFAGETYPPSPPPSCNGTGQVSFASGDEVVAEYAARDIPIWLCFVVLLAAGVVATVATWSLLGARARAWRRM